MLLLLFINALPCHSQTSCFRSWHFSPCTFGTFLIIPLNFACYSSEWLGRPLVVSKAWYSVYPTWLHPLWSIPDCFVPCRAYASFFPWLLFVFLHSSALSSIWFTSGVFIARVTCIMNVLGHSLRLSLNSFYFPSVSLMCDAFGYFLT